MGSLGCSQMSFARLEKRSFFMKLFTSLEFNSLEDLFIEQIEDLYDAEKRLTRALPKMAEASHSPDLRNAFQTHLRETEGHVVRLERIFQKLGRSPERETCEAMKGLIAEAQRVEHYEIAAYGTARTFARQLGREAIANELQETLDEEGNADKILTEIAESVVNVRAPQA